MKKYWKGLLCAVLTAAMVNSQCQPLSILAKYTNSSPLTVYALEEEQEPENTQTEETPDAEDTSGTVSPEESGAGTSEETADGSAEDSSEQVLPEEESSEEAQAETSDEVTESSETAVQSEDTEDVLVVYSDSYKPTENVVNTINTILGGLKAAGSSTASLGQLAGILTRTGGAFGIASGVFTIIQMFLPKTDPKAEAMAEIRRMLKEENQSLNELSKNVIDLTNQLKNLEADTKIKSNQRKAETYEKIVTRYRTRYTNAMETYMAEYQGYVMEGLREWSLNTGDPGLYGDAVSTDALTVYYANLEDGGKTVTYAKGNDVSLTQSALGETIVPAWTIQVPREYLAAALYEMYGGEVSSWSADTYEEMMTECLANAVYAAAEAGELVLDSSSTFQKDWAGLDEQGKQAEAQQIASDLLISLIYNVSCKKMTQYNTDFVVEVASTYQNMVKALHNTDNGLNAMLKSLYLTHSFEGEIKDEINQNCEEMKVVLGLYGLFVMSIEAQDDLFIAEEEKTGQNAWIDAEDTVSRIQKNATTGYDNYCYLTNSLITVEQYDIGAHTTLSTYYRMNRKAFVTHPAYGLGSVNADPWTCTEVATGTKVSSISNALNGVTASVIYKLFKETGGSADFVDSLKKYGVLSGVSEDWNGTILTSYSGAVSFNMSSGIPMTAFKVVGTLKEGNNPSFFKDGSVYQINTSTGKNDRYFTVHEKAVGDVFSLKDGTISSSSVLASRAVYWHDQSGWETAEPWYFSGVGQTTSTEGNYYGVLDFNQDDDEKANFYTYNFQTDQKYYALICKPVPSGDDLAEDSEAEGDEYYPLDCLNDWIDSSSVETTMDFSSTSHADAEEWTSDDWEDCDNDDFDIVNSFEVTDDQVLLLVEAAAEQYSVSMTDEEKNALVSQIQQMLTDARAEYRQNKSLNLENNLDPFGIYENEEKTMALAKAVLPDTAKDADGNPIEPDGNMITFGTYEPFVDISFENGKPVLTLMVAYIPYLAVYDSTNDVYTEYEISDDVIQSLGLTMNIRLSTAGTASGTEVSVLHYLDEYGSTTETVQATAKGSGTSSYVKVKTSHTGIFTLAVKKADSEESRDSGKSDVPGKSSGTEKADTSSKSGSGTGDTFHGGLLAAVIAACAGLAAAMFALLRKKKYS